MSRGGSGQYGEAVFVRRPYVLMLGLDLPLCVPTGITKLPSRVRVGSEDVPEHPDLTGSSTWMSFFWHLCYHETSMDRFRHTFARFQHEEEEDDLISLRVRMMMLIVHMLKPC
ncbi:hypothetical protein VPH35_106184 [Triticum aestivum]